MREAQQQQQQRTAILAYGQQRMVDDAFSNVGRSLDKTDFGRKT